MNSTNFSQDLCNYTKEGRVKLHKHLINDVAIEINKLLKTIFYNDKLEYADNRISRYSMQSGKCAITGEFLVAEEVHCHHRILRHMGGTDEFKNLVIVHRNVHKLIHATETETETETETIERYKSLLQLDGKQLEKLNQFSHKCNLVTLV
ncbi:HNH endonuclease signature motif containing protein [Lysinibacillus sp. NPDC048646]|uniref:HNH endonuclease signature motif containing protein n=1 Tax=Lysinibacillus sp. NPDC048646 TaxID=3390574 RepID=UPI003D077553